MLSRPDQTRVVEEFFELFKTPWEFYRQGRTYDVVLATTDDVPEIDTKLLVISGATPKSSDRANLIGVPTPVEVASLCFQDVSLPIYGPLATFAGGTARADILAKAGGGAVAVVIRSAHGQTMRLGYDLFGEVEFLLGSGQPVETAHIPTLDLHIDLLRRWILMAGVPLVEIPPAPAGYNFAVALTHDIDFVGIRNHRFDHTMFGFLYRSTIGAARELLRGRLSIRRALRMWRAVISLPFVYLGWAKDFWEPFGWYLRTEQGLPATYFLIPFKGRAGENVPGPHAARRATAYDIGDVAEWVTTLTKHGCEVGVHGIDAWHSAQNGRAERARVVDMVGADEVGIRMHWLLNAKQTPALLEEAGYTYDSSAGYNDAIGYLNGTAQVFRPLGIVRLLELPMHIQDGALFFPGRLQLSEADAWDRCGDLMSHADKRGGVLTVLWHDRSHGPERFWGDFYARLVTTLRASNAWFGTAAQIVGWFGKRRSVRFESRGGASRPLMLLSYEGEEIVPPVRIRLHRPSGIAGSTASGQEPPYVDVPWNGRTALDLDPAEQYSQYSMS